MKDWAKLPNLWTMVNLQIISIRQEAKGLKEWEKAEKKIAKEQKKVEKL